MISDIDVYRAAKLLIDQYGEDAPIRAAERANELLEAGNTEGASSRTLAAARTVRSLTLRSWAASG
jgi:hypothetical protein